MAEEQEKRTSGPVISGKATIKKKNIFQKFRNALVREDSKSIGEYIVEDVVIPMVIGGIQKTLHSVVDAYFNKGGTGTGYTYGQTGWKPPISMISYGDFYNKNKQQAQPVAREAMSDFGDIIVPTKADADEVICQMDELISKFTQASILDLLDLIGETGPTTLNRYGWTDFSAARAVRMMDGTYKIVTPRAELLQRD